MLACFDQEGDEKLYHFRFLPAERRAAAASYIVNNRLDLHVSVLCVRRRRGRGGRRRAVARRVC